MERVNAITPAECIIQRDRSPGPDLGRGTGGW